MNGLFKKKSAISMNKNRERAFERVSMEGQVYIHDENQLFISPLSNLSEGGAYIEGLTGLPNGSPVRIVIKSPHLKKAISVHGTVVRVESEMKTGTAVQFESLKESFKTQIRNTVVELKSAPGKVSPSPEKGQGRRRTYAS